jgi:hypothetical protein
MPVTIRGSGQVPIQVIQATTATAVSTTSTSYVTSGLSASITPSSSSNKVLVTVSLPVFRISTPYSAICTLFRGTVAGTDLGTPTWGFSNLYFAGNNGIAGTFTFSYIDSPSTTSATTYTAGIKTENGSMTVTVCPNGALATIVLQEISGS